MISTIINNVNCGAGEVLGTGLNHCPIDINRITTLELTKRGFKYDDATGDTLAYIREQQQKGNILILQGVVETTVNTADDNITTRTGSGIDKLSGKNPVGFSFTFDNGIYFSKAIQELISYGQYDLAMYDSQGNKFFVTTSAGDFKGFSCYQINASAYMPSNGADSASQMLTLQLNRNEYDTKISWLTADNLDYTADTDLDGYNDLTIEIISALDSDTDFVFDVYSKADNKKVAIDGLAKEDFILTRDGVNDVIVSITADATIKGRYNGVATVAFASPDALVLKTYDSALSTDIVDVEGVLYKSNSATYTVSA